MRPQFLPAIATVSLLLATLAVPPAGATEPFNRPLMISTETLARMSEDPSIRVFDVRPVEAYEAGHVPGARHLAADNLTDPIEGSVLLREDLATMLGALGVGPDNRIVIYDSQDGLHAARLFWLLETLGHTRASVLSGGYAAWEREGWMVSAETPVTEPVEYPIDLAARPPIQ
ncbi:MAG: rhodanese-like domain-containing protein [Pseudomonadota bacterium]